jgi:hypothetical protein
VVGSWLNLLIVKHRILPSAGGEYGHVMSSSIKGGTLVDHGHSVWFRVWIDNIRKVGTIAACTYQISPSSLGIAQTRGKENYVIT